MLQSRCLVLRCKRKQERGTFSYSSGEATLKKALHYKLNKEIQSNETNDRRQEVSVEEFKWALNEHKITRSEHSVNIHRILIRLDKTFNALLTSQRHWRQSNTKQKHLNNCFLLSLCLTIDKVQNKLGEFIWIERMKENNKKRVSEWSRNAETPQHFVYSTKRHPLLQIYGWPYS